MVKNKAEVYKCSVCGNIVEVNHVGGGELHCCGKPMNLLAENTEDAATEKHVPVIEKVDNGIKVIVGEVEHPMEDSHYIQWVELIVGDKIYKEYLSPGNKPEAVFELNVSGKVIAREYCNLHGLWKAEAEI
ncbi:MAG: desulfoferrodoxin [Candidatus Komeilibacteria bacterium]